MKGLSMELWLLAAILLVIIGALLMLAQSSPGAPLVTALIAWGGIIVGAIVAVVRGSSTPPKD